MFQLTDCTPIARFPRADRTDGLTQGIEFFYTLCHQQQRALDVGQDMSIPEVLIHHQNQ